ncbi:MAG: putative lipoic acid-binding regulatory protein [Paracoccaceae bacterium]
MPEPEAPKIEFPCAYPIKVMGDNGPGFRDLVLQVMTEFSGPVDDKDVSVRMSRTGKFSSVTVTITATGERQLKAIFEALKATGRVQMVL